MPSRFTCGAVAGTKIVAGMPSVPRGVRDAEPVIAGRRRDDATRARSSVGSVSERVDRAAQLERAGDLLVLAA